MSAPANLRCLENSRLRGFSLSEIYVLEQNFSTSFLHLQIAENLPANLAAWAQSINDVQAWLVSFLIQHTSLTASKSFSEQLLKPLLY